MLARTKSSAARVGACQLEMQRSSVVSPYSGSQ
jgi:hypothetical protein